MKRKFNGAMIECVRGNIASQSDMEAIINAANAQLRSGGGVAGAIHQAAGSGLEKECRALAPIQPGQAVITGAYDLPNRSVIHCLGPVYGQDEPADELLSACYANALRVADQHDIRSIAFPAISTGIFGYPKEAAVTVALQTILEEVTRLSTVSHIRVVLFEHADQQLYERYLRDWLIQGQLKKAASSVLAIFPCSRCARTLRAQKWLWPCWTDFLNRPEVVDRQGLYDDNGL